MIENEYLIFAGGLPVADGLWAPWRMEYILGPKADACIFCLPQSDEEDNERLVLYRGRRAFVILNRYPYACGHLMIAPKRHVRDYCDLQAEEYSELFLLSQRCVAVLSRHCSPHGFNLGFNLGSAGGAGIADHLHYHVVPRWNGDTSFMAVLAETRMLSQHLGETYVQLKPHFDSFS